MTLLVDRLRADPLKFSNAPNANPELVDWFLSQHTPVFEVSNVARYLADHPEQYVDIESFPSIAPPHKVYWIEWARPSRLMYGLYAGNEPDRVATLFFPPRAKDLTGWDMTATTFAEWSGKIEAQVTWHLRFSLDAPPTIERTVVYANSWKRWRGALSPEEHLPYSAGVTEEILALPWSERMTRLQEMLADADVEIAELEEKMGKNHAQALALTVLHPALMAHAFLACKNVTLHEHVPPPKLSKSFQRKRGVPLVTYKTLEIKPMGAAASTPGNTGGFDQRLHIVRGHFKTFTADKPLFGRHTGRYWWTPAVKGSKESGVVIKDYRVSAE